MSTYTQFLLCINNVLLNEFELIVGLNCYEEHSTLQKQKPKNYNHNKFEKLVMTSCAYPPCGYI